MSVIKRLLLVLTLAVLPCLAEAAAQEPTVPAVAAAPEVDAGARLYVSRCTGCHTIGRGSLTGPDLSASIKWREADLETAILRMQEKSGPLLKEEVSELIGFLKDPKVSDRSAAEEARIALKFAAKLVPPDAATGGRLFRGSEELKNGGMACIACHKCGATQGGTLGPDLGDVFARLGETGLVSACEKAPFKVMAPIYREKPVTRQEALHLARWFGSVAHGEPASGRDPIVPAAASLALFSLAALVVGTRRKQRVAARETLSRRTRS